MARAADSSSLSRRRFLAAAGVALSGLRPALAGDLAPTPAQTAGPFYPSALPADLDYDLVRVTGMDADALGTVAHVRGRVLDRLGRPLAGALLEIWQCDANGRYLHPGDAGEQPRDPRFQGYGRTVADAGGGYRFRTIRPVPYGGRTPHIHFAVAAPGGRRLVTQMYVAGEPRNETDFVLNRVGDSALRALVVVALAPAPDIEPGALAGTFDIVLG